jgi:ribosomal-protein-alanine N-acetyltransferase
MPLLNSKNLVLRIAGADDVESIHRLLSLPESNIYNTAAIPADIQASGELLKGWLEAYQRQELYPFAIELKGGKELVGLISLRPGKKHYRRAEVSYKIFPEHWNKGYATNALKALIQFGFEDLGLHRIEAGCAVENIGSVKVLEKSGMTREGRCRQLLPLSTGWSDNFEYAILENDLPLAESSAASC